MALWLAWCPCCQYFEQSLSRPAFPTSTVANKLVQMLSLLRKFHVNEAPSTDTGTDRASSAPSEPPFGVAFAEHVFPLKDWDGLYALLQACQQYPDSLPSALRWDHIEKAVRSASKEEYTSEDLRFVAERLEHRYGKGEALCPVLLRASQGLCTGLQPTSPSTAQAPRLLS